MFLDTFQCSTIIRSSGSRDQAIKPNAYIIMYTYSFRFRVWLLFYVLRDLLKLIHSIEKKTPVNCYLRLSWSILGTRKMSYSRYNVLVFFIENTYLLPLYKNFSYTFKQLHGNESIFFIWSQPDNILLVEVWLTS